MIPINLVYIAEFKKRLLKCVILYIIILTPFIIYAGQIYTLFAKPLLNNLPANSHLIATHITSSFTVPLKLAGLSAFFCIIPYITIQIWGFIAPALYLHEKKYLKILLFLSIFLFYIGASLAYYIVCPLSIRFFAHMAPQGVLIMTDMGHYLSFVCNLMLAFGCAFQIPVILIGCIYAGITSTDILRAKRKYIIVGSFIIGMLLTPPDVGSQILLALPLWGLFEISLFLSTYFHKLDLNHKIAP